MSSRGIFITGTDTGVGKTRVACAIASALYCQGIDAGVMKPAETGCASRRGVLLPADALALIAATRSTDPLDLVNPYRFPEPLAPAVAAKLAGRSISLNRILTAFRRLSRTHEFMVVEGAGGIMVPLTGRMTFLDLAAAMGLPVLIIARSGLGTINHTMLTVMALRTRDLLITGIVLNDSTGGRRDASSRTNAGVIERMTGLPVLGSIRHGQQGLPRDVLRAVQ